jgi:ketosteroid isomerase-like protein
MASSSLEQRIAAVEARLAIADTMNAYSHAIDYGDATAWAATFTEDGVFDVRDREGNSSRVLRGRAELLDFAEHFSRPPARWHKHLLLSPVITLVGDGDAESIAYHAVLVEHAEGARVWEFGRYRDTLARAADGRWRLARRISEVEALTPGIPLLAFSHTP